MPIPTEVSPGGSRFTETGLRPIATHDLHQRGSPAPRFEVEKPRGRSLSPACSRPAAPAPAPAPSPAASSSQPQPYVAPPLTWRTAAQDAKAGIYYTKDDFPSSSASFLPPPFSREPVQVRAGERVELLDEVDEYAVRVRVLRTGQTGLIPAWNTEGALDRLTRINTAFNEAATCPVEARALRRRFSESSAVGCHAPEETSTAPSAASDPALSHAHARCVPFAARVRFGEQHYASPALSDDSGSGSDSDDSDAAPLSPPDRGRALAHSEPAVFRTQPSTLERGGLSGAGRSQSRGGGGRKSVVFPETERPQVVFRYPSEDLVGAFLGEYQERKQEAAEEAEEEDGEWWWQGWEEPLEELEAELQRTAEDGAEDSEDGDGEDERGRAREVKMMGVEPDARMDEGVLPRWLVAIEEEDH